QCLVGRSRTRGTAENPPGVPSDVERALDLFGKTIGIRPGFAEAYLEYARVLMVQGRSPGPAIHLLEVARPLLPSRIDIVANLAVLYARKGDSAVARDLVENVLARMNDREAVEQARRRIRIEEDYRAAEQAAAARQAGVPGMDDESVDAAPGEGPPELPLFLYDGSVT